MLDVMLFIAQKVIVPWTFTYLLFCKIGIILLDEFDGLL